MNTNSFSFEIVFDKDTSTRRVKLLSDRYYRYFLNTKTKVGDKGTITINLKKPTRSQQQLRYYAVLVGLIAEQIGESWESAHEALMKLKWGTKQVKIGSDVVEVRRSVSDSAEFPKSDMAEQIEFTLQKCVFLEIRVPTAEEMGYIPNYKPYSKPIKPFIHEKN